MISIKSDREIEVMKKSCQLAAKTLNYIESKLEIGMTTDEVNELCHKFIIENGAYPSPLNYHGFPKSVCTSLNEVICHGIPDARPLQEGDILNCDISVFKDGFHGDLNESFLIGKCSKSSRDLVTATYDSLQKAIDICKPDTMYRQLGNVISEHTENLGFSVVRTYVGHGIGRLFHCSAPNVPHYKNNKANGFMKPGNIF